MNPTQTKARIAGLLYLVLVISGIFGLMVVPSRLIVHGDAAATVRNLAASPMLFRVSVLNGLLSSFLFLVLVLALYDLFKEVDKALAALMAILVMIQLPGAVIDGATQLLALDLAQGNATMAAFNGAQRDSMVMLLLQFDRFVTTASHLGWGLWLFPLGTLVWRSGFLPKALGVWLILNGLAYVALCFIGILLPQAFTRMSSLAFPLLLGEVAFMLWLVILGVRKPQAA